MIVTLQCNLEFDVNHLPEDFEEQVQNAFARYTKGTAKDYTYQDKLCFIDVAVRKLHGDKNTEEAVREIMHDVMDYQLDEYGDIPDKSDYLSTDFMEHCYSKGKESQRLYSHNFAGAESHSHDEENIMKMLIRLIKVVLDYER